MFVSKLHRTRAVGSMATMRTGGGGAFFGSKNPVDPWPGGGGGAAAAATVKTPSLSFALRGHTTTRTGTMSHLRQHRWGSLAFHSLAWFHARIHGGSSGARPRRHEDAARLSFAVHQCKPTLSKPMCRHVPST